MNTLWTQRYVQRTQRMQSAAIRELFKLTERPEMISFAGALPVPEVFVAEVHRCMVSLVVPRCRQEGTRGRCWRA